MTRPAIGFTPVLSENALGPRAPRFVWDGRPPREPRKGEHYLSGAIVCAYRARADMATPYFIAVKLPGGDA